jgi:hypothetical protein
VPALRKQLVFSKAYLAADRRPGFTPTDILERGGLFRPWHFQNIGDYEPITGILEGEVDLVTIYIGIHHAPYKKLVTFLTSISQVIRKGGYLILREHDCDSPEMHQMAAMAHDVFNIATGVSWEENAREVRNFHSVSQFEILLSAYDFVKTEPGLLQEGDPTRNTLLVFRKQ